MLVYVVRAWNGEEYDASDWWTCGVFASKKAADEYIKEQPEKYAKDMARINELSNLTNVRELTDEEAEEYRERNNRWCWSNKCPTYFIEQFKLQGVES